METTWNPEPFLPPVDWIVAELKELTIKLILVESGTDVRNRGYRILAEELRDDWANKITAMHYS